MAIQRSALVRGPASVKTGSVTIQSQGGVSSDFVTEAANVESDMYAGLDAFVSNKYGTTSLTPAGALSAGLLALLYPQQTPVLGSSLFGTSDTPFIIHSKAGNKLTWVNYGLWQPPSLRLSATKASFGSAAQFRHVLKDNTATDASGAYYAFATEAWAAATYPLGASTLKAGAVTASIGAAAVTSADGFELSVSLGWAPVTDDSLGVLDYTLQSASAAITFTPSSGTEAALLALTPFAKAVGASVRPGGSTDFTVTSANGVTMQIHDPYLLQGPLRWGNTMLRQGQLAFAGLVEVTADVPGTLYEVSFA